MISNLIHLPHLSNLTKRIITALCLITFVILGIWSSTPFYFSIFSGFFVLLAAYEWAVLVRFKLKTKILFLGIFLLLMLSSIWIAPILILGLACLFWIGAFYPVLSYKNNEAYIKTACQWVKNTRLMMVIGIMVLFPFWVAITSLFNIDKKLLLILILIVAAQDSGAYFIGKRWGKHKLLEQVSPGKTWEGVLGGIIVAMLVVLFTLPHALMGISLALMIFSILGDLFESVIKRLFHAKDSGTILPGHGGLLDRIDSLTAGAPFFVMGVLWMLH